MHMHMHMTCACACKQGGPLGKHQKARTRSQLTPHNFVDGARDDAGISRTEAAPNHAPHQALTPHMLFELWRWKPRLVWLIMHAVTLGLLWCSLAWPTQAQFGALLATTAALYVSISFVDPGYVELASTSAPVPDRASLSALTVPLVLQARVRHAHTMHVQISTAHAHAMHLPCTCHARAMHVPCTCRAHAMHMPRCRRATCAWSTSRRVRSTATTAAGACGGWTTIAGGLATAWDSARIGGSCSSSERSRCCSGGPAAPQSAAW